MTGSPKFQQAGDALYVELPAAFDLPFPAFVALVRGVAGENHIDWTAVREAYLYARGRHFPIGSRDESAALREKAKVRFSPDGLSAYLIFYPPKPKGRRLEETEIYDLIASYGVAEELVNHREIKNVLHRRDYGEPLLIAQGRNAVSPPPVRLEWAEPAPPTDPEGFLAALPLLGVFPERVLTPVAAGKTVARRIVAAPGKPGINARGQTIPAKAVIDPNLYGEGLQIAGAARELVAAQKPGHLRVTGIAGIAGAFCAGVVPGREIHDSQALLECMGNGFFVGSLIYHGDLEVAYPVYVLGNLEVRGALVSTKVRVAGSLFVRDGIIHTERQPVQCSGLVTAGFFDHAGVAAHTVHVRRHSLHSQLYAMDRVLGARGSSLVGGHIEAGRLIEADVMGAQQSSQTRVCIGNQARSTLSLAFRQWLEQLSRQLAEGAALPEPLLEELSLLKLPPGEGYSPAVGKIIARNVFPGVSIGFDSLSRDVKDTVSNVTFTFERLGDKERIAMARA